MVNNSTNINKTITHLISPLFYNLWKLWFSLGTPIWWPNKTGGSYSFLP